MRHFKGSTRSGEGVRNESQRNIRGRAAPGGTMKEKRKSKSFFSTQIYKMKYERS